MSYATRFALAAAFAAFSVPALASEADFLKRFHGSFSGSGQVRVNGDTHAITCRMSGSSTATSVNMRGTCSAGMVSKNISASLRASGNGRYSGTYSGVDGSASLSGRRKGNSIVLSVGGSKPGTMTISNSGSSIALSVVSNKQQTTRVSLARSGAQLASIGE
jgi:hypothetical protein